MSNHEEFPDLTSKALAACEAACVAWGVPTFNNCPADRRALSAFLLEAMWQAGACGPGWDTLLAIANNLHSPPPPTPTLAEAREADLSTPAGRDVFHAFLATLAAETQP